jgi:hypothetical protein
MTHQYAGIAANMDIKQAADVTSYAKCIDFLAGQPAEVVASNVLVRRNTEHDFIAIVLYRTEIVRYYPDGTFSVDNGGYNTPTTVRRVTQFTPVGYSAFHDKKLMRLNGQPTGHDNRYPVNKENN